ncbi:MULTISPECIES: hypothetical protein [unclassified Campylobacter]|uniref:hypothetical protein n=1 Tax=unclassified Campylobacter TaxID=2593542 RepID=UPI001238095C|nr:MULTISPECIES: hypothetical protein [unclassified Campylobacter]KAA6225222.1 hypothetical protein FMM55_08095 [Campylobacter sp. LR196d]KAA6226233.1 hypothetical protein FMM54_05470 [Campylobacter sp. LR185c]KAA6228966.1 hypothetical protein FMM57_01775 [Campylobacter sp. LR286c]KAA6231435.1 hypothetical protein FMM56_04620 [Campylobacter sp. LR264d]KAA6231647.1 hypothetical protein FMM58_03410 [Campylobacter sp. LR291e]
MNESYAFFIALHIYTLYASSFLMLFYLFLTQTKLASEFMYIRRIRLFLPAYYLFLALILFTGLLLWSVKKFELNFNILLMLVIYFLVFILALLHYKSFKKARKKRYYGMFRFFSVIVLILEIILLFTPYLLTKYAVLL